LNNLNQPYMKKATLFLAILFVASLVTQAQENPFKEYGVKGEVLTLSKGKYKETFYNEEIMQVGTVLINTQTYKVVKFLEEDTTKYAYRAETTSRFLTVDPLAEEYYSWSPYVYVKNNPLKYIDPDGRKIVPAGTAEFVAKVNATIEYMKEKGSWDGVMSSLDARSEDIYIREISSSFGSFNDPESMNIYWDPTTIVETDTGAKLSPATVLIHEGDHKLQQLENPEQQKKDRNTPSKEVKRTNKEEERVIRGSEQKAATKHGEIKEGEVTRNDYKSKATYKTDDPTSNKPKENEKK